MIANVMYTAQETRSVPEVTNMKIATSTAQAAIAELNEYGGIRTVCDSLKYLFTCGRPPDVFEEEAPMIEPPDRWAEMIRPTPL